MLPLQWRFKALDSGFHAVDSGFQSPRFRILRVKIPALWIFPVSEIRIPLRGVNKLFKRESP